MANRWGNPEWLEKEVIKRDKFCVYCGVKMTEKMPHRGSRRALSTWEHIINAATMINRKNVARCWAACNSSKGTKAFPNGFNRIIVKSMK